MVDWETVKWDIFNNNGEWVVKNAKKNSGAKWVVAGLSHRTILSLLKQHGENDFYNKYLELKEKQALKTNELHSEWLRVKYTTLMPKNEEKVCEV